MLLLCHNSKGYIAWKTNFVGHQVTWNNQNLECFYLVIQAGSTHINDISGLASTVVTWDSKLTATQKPFLVHRDTQKKICHGFNIFPIDILGL